MKRVQGSRAKPHAGSIEVVPQTSCPSRFLLETALEHRQFVYVSRRGCNGLVTFVGFQGDPKAIRRDASS